jgi:hypothetical protein
MIAVFSVVPDTPIDMFSNFRKLYSMEFQEIRQLSFESFYLSINFPPTHVVTITLKCHSSVKVTSSHTPDYIIL